MNQNSKKLHKIILLGDAGSGKTALVNQLMLGQFFQNYKATIGFSYYSKEFKSDDKSCILQIWDTAGQERFQSLANSYYRGSDCCILVYDITNQKSFDTLDNWYEKVLKELTGDNVENFPFILVGNKLDLEQERKIPRRKGEDWAKAKQNVKFFEASAKNNVNVNEIFGQVAKCAEAYSNPDDDDDIFANNPVALGSNGDQTIRQPSQSNSCSC